MQKKIVIGVTDCSKYANYSNWIQSSGEGIEVIKLSYSIQNIGDVEQCDGVVLTGGEDVHPRFYNHPELYKYCYADDVSEERDDFEWKVLEYTEKKGLPVLGICRGLQIANVFFGGTLIPDIPRWGKFNHSKMPDNTDRYHNILVDPNSWLHGLVESEAGAVNSNHHQSVDLIGEGLIVSALSPDGVIEALERKEPGNKSFLCLVQWHPERMKNPESKFVKNIRTAFIEECSK